jgi:hypothetical protein
MAFTHTNKGDIGSFIKGRIQICNTVSFESGHLANKRKKSPFKYLVQNTQTNNCDNNVLHTDIISSI